MKKPVVLLVTIAVILSVLGAGGWFFASPYLAVRAMKSAADARDAATLNSYVDFPAVRASLKNAAAAKSAALPAAAPDSPFAALGAAIAQAFVDPMIDFLVTPENLSRMLQGNVPQRATSALAATAPDADVDTSMGYSSLSTFVLDVKGKGSTGGPIEFILSRSGLADWKLTSIRLP